MTEVRKPAVGDMVTYTNPVGKSMPALVTAVWGQDCINLVFVDMTDGQTDSYGQKIGRESSLMRQSEGSAHGRFWTN